MNRVILTSTSGLGLRFAGRAEMVVPLIFRLVWGPLPSPAHLDGYLRARSLSAETHWSDFVPRSPQGARRHKGASLFWFCETYGVDVVELWFDPSPNDQLQLIWALCHIRSDLPIVTPLRLRLVDFDLASSDGAALRSLDVREFEATENQFETARLAWAAYQAPTPRPCADLLARNLDALPLLKPALQKLLAELPSPATGLGATEMRFLELIAKGHDRSKDLFGPRELSDTPRVFDRWESETLLEGLALGPVPAVAGLDDALRTIDPDDQKARASAFSRSRLTLTKFGDAVLAGQEDFRRHNPIRRWWGGTHLTNDRLWRWDGENRSLVAPS